MEKEEKEEVPRMSNTLEFGGVQRISKHFVLYGVELGGGVGHCSPDHPNPDGRSTQVRLFMLPRQ